MTIPLLGTVAKPKRLHADSTYDADSFRNWLRRRKIKAVIPSTATRRTPYPLEIGTATRLIATPKTTSQGSYGERCP